MAISVEKELAAKLALDGLAKESIRAGCESDKGISDGANKDHNHVLCFQNAGLFESPSPPKQKGIWARIELSTGFGSICTYPYPSTMHLRGAFARGQKEKERKKER